MTKQSERKMNLNDENIAYIEQENHIMFPTCRICKKPVPAVTKGLCDSCLFSVMEFKLLKKIIE